MEKPEIYGIIGNPVKHSLSPLIHNFLFKKYRINACYDLFEIKENQLPKAIEGIRILGIKGVNVTAPYKEKVIPVLDEIENEAKLIGAVNTIVNKEGKLIGYNTDVSGIEKSLAEKLKLSPKDKKIVVLGAGGAAKACIFTLLKYSPREILIFNRTLERARKLRKNLAKYSRNTTLSFYNLEKLSRVLKEEKIFLVINATSDENPLIKKSFLKILNNSKNKTHIFDLNYNFSRNDKILTKEPKFVDGTYMLVAQALESFYFWTKIRPEFTIVLRLVTNHIKRGNNA